MSSNGRSVVNSATMTMMLLHLMLLLPMAGSVLPKYQAKPDTLPVKASQHVKPASRQAPAPMIMPGTRLDKRFNSMPAQPPAVGKAAPSWLRANISGSPMYVVNGKVASAAQLKTLRQTDVASINVLDGSRAATLYGKNARNGMVIITMKKGLTPEK